MNIVVFEDGITACEPSSEELREYAEFLGIDLKKEKHLEWIARDGFCAPVPPPWKACTENGQEFFYFNFETGESVWDHPCDEKYRNMVAEYRKKYVACRFLPSPAMESMLENMWCGGIKCHKPTFEKIQSQVIAKCNVLPQVCLVPHVFPGFEQKIADYADVTQSEIDDAWLDAAVDVLGRPAIRLPPDHDSLGYSRPDGDDERFWFHMDMDFWELTQHDDQRMSSTRYDIRTAFRPTTSFDVDRFDVTGAFLGSLDSFTDVASWPEWIQNDVEFFGSYGPEPRPDIERTFPDLNTRNFWLSRSPTPM